VTYVFPPQPQVTAAIKGSDELFPVNRIHCVGRNYAAHIREMGFDPDREPPFFFQKPTDALVANEVPIPYPASTENFQYEIELVAAIGKAGKDISIEDALDYVWGYATGIDLTRRDLQMAARERGRPWEPGKAFDRSAPMAPIVPVAECGHLEGAEIWLNVNGEQKQRSTVGHLVWSVAEVISILSKSWELIPGDLIFTGTPEGVGPLVAGDEVVGGVDGLPDVSFKIT
jgi:fumarylpyruvate hydrolase